MLIDILEKARVAYGKSIVIESGFRCEKHNKEVKGVPGSSHTLGQAADIRCYLAADRYALLKIFLTLGIHRIGIGRSFLHIDVSETLPANVVWTYGDF